jgi:ATP-dependent Zn protease
MGAAQQKKIATAWHEAGHIVVGTHFGLRLMRASIKPRDWNGEMSCGQTEWEPIRSGDIMPVICASLAGRAVEERRYGTVKHDADRDDQAVIQALAWICKAGRKDGYKPHLSLMPQLTAVYREQPDRVPLKVKAFATELVSQAMPATVQVLNDHWSDVQRVATLLLKNTTITPDLLSRNSTRVK